MAADSAIFSGDVIAAHKRKIVRDKNGALAAAAGIHGICGKFTDWFVGGRSGPWTCESDDFGALIVETSGEVFVVERNGYVFPLQGADFWAEGAAAQMAIGAMAAGASAREAVEICIRHHLAAAGNVQVEYLKTVTIAASGGHYTGREIG